MAELERPGAQSTLGSVFRQLKYEHMVAGITGGVFSTLVVHPLDLLKIRFQVNDGLKERPMYLGLSQATRSIISQNGVRGLYQGLVPNVLGAGACWGFYFFFYNTLKACMQGDSTDPLGAGQHMLAAAQSGVLTHTLTNPIWVVKTRLYLQYEGIHRGASKNHVKQYRGVNYALCKIYRYEGVGGLYKGFVPGLFGVSNGILQLMTYEEMKKLYASYTGGHAVAQLGTAEYLTFAALSRTFAAVTTYPYRVIRSRLQDQHSIYRGVWDTIVKTMRGEGFRGFYKGVGIYALQTIPKACLIFLFYEKVPILLTSFQHLPREEMAYHGSNVR